MAWPLLALLWALEWISLFCGVGACLSGTFAESLPRTVTWPSTLTSLDQWNQVVPFFFQPPAFLDRWAKADFALLDASLSLPCAVLPARELEVVFLPEAWIEWLPALEAGARQVAADQSANAAVTMCDLFAVSNVSQDVVPGCQDWSRLEAWRRLRIFYDIRSPISAKDASVAHQRQCGDANNNGTGGNVTWSMSVSTLMRQWMAERSPWVRPNATLPIAMISKELAITPSDASPVQAELHLTYWMDSK